MNKERKVLLPVAFAISPFGAFLPSCPRIHFAVSSDLPNRAGHWWALKRVSANRMVLAGAGNENVQKCA